MADKLGELRLGCLYEMLNYISFLKLSLTDCLIAKLLKYIYIHTPLFKNFEKESLEVNPILQLT